ncbi:hypothetical protein R9C00_16850 [Flammeovirgaceae bacterium SG7u.111]|nr:hypothetical protein [Flammeovirgaceae bacterium SG7u.132]WPO33370.1 hypothetical protein R9C00_16850 [Flammeovirgaceae bacterium SG7u.111]
MAGLSPLDRFFVGKFGLLYIPFVLGNTCLVLSVLEDWIGEMIFCNGWMIGLLDAIKALTIGAGRQIN